MMLVEWRPDYRKLYQPALYVSVVALTVCNFSVARADWAESMGIGQKSTNLGGAVTATSDDYDAFYTNPAGAANFNALFIGSGLKVMDTRTLSVQQSGATPQGAAQSGLGSLLNAFGQSSMANLFQAPQNGLDISPERTLPGSAMAVVPSFGVYAPMPGWERIVFGVGMGSPFLVSADYGHENVPGNYGRFDTTSAGMVIVETTPTVAIKVTDSLNLGASVGLTTFKYVQISSAIGAPSIVTPSALNLGAVGLGGLSIPLGALGNKKVGLGAGSIGSMSLKTSNNVKLPGIEPAFETGMPDISYTLGAQYKFTDKLSGGVTYRSKTPETFTGTATANINPLGLQNPLTGQFLSVPGINWGLSTPAYKASSRFSYSVELPADVQLGLAYGVTPKWKIMGDIRWTNWSDAKGFGTPTTIKLLDNTINPGAALTANPCTLTKLTNCNAVASLLGMAGVKSAPIKSITVNYHAQDTYSVHLGTSYKLTPSIELQAGYVYDPSFMPSSSEDLITLSSNRHIFSLGSTYTVPTASGGEWAFTGGGQVAYYEHRHIAANESQTAGGINGLQGMLSNSSDLSYGPNTLGGFDIGGYVWSAGASVSYKWGSAKPQLEAAK
jgi:long-chain fatty acid transport protein